MAAVKAAEERLTADDEGSGMTEEAPEVSLQAIHFSSTIHAHQHLHNA